MQKRFLHIAAVVAVMLAGCRVDTPTQAPVAADESIAEMIAGAVGYESNGFASAVSDVMIAAQGGILSSDGGLQWKQAAAVEPTSEVLNFSRRRNDETTHAEWRLAYRIDRYQTQPSEGRAAMTEYRVDV